MKDGIFQIVKNFVSEHHLEGKPVLLGFSGGPDSLALLHLLLECRASIPIDIHLAHVDHGWRESSAEEARVLQKQATSEGLPFYLCTLQSHHFHEGNLEAKCREARLRFFLEIYRQKKFQALLLAHQADDQAETVLKRLFEGGGLLGSGGMLEISSYNEMTIWRPLLKISKHSLLNWLQKRGLKFIDDITNNDPRFLRTRLRQELIPMLERSFGKNIRENLIRHGQLAQDLKIYLRKKTTPIYQSIQRGPLGAFIDFNPFFPFEKVEMKGFLKNFLAEEGLSLSYKKIQTICDHLEKRQANCQVVSAYPSLSSVSLIKGGLLNPEFKDGQKVIVDRGVLFVLKTDLPKFQGNHKLESTEITQGHWIWEIIMSSSSSAKEFCSWRDLWLGKALVILPKGDYELVPSYEHDLRRTSSRLKNCWSSHKIPAFLRAFFPLVSQQGRIVYDFLSGKKFLGTAAENIQLRIELKKCL
ncbi:MAG: tRNA lysidine(34) synthetase TilS [Anaerolineae bacterium]